MKSPSVEGASGPESEDTGLPWLRTWNSIYGFVLGCFAVWVILLILLTMAFS